MLCGQTGMSFTAQVQRLGEERQKKIGRGGGREQGTRGGKERKGRREKGRRDEEEGRSGGKQED